MKTIFFIAIIIVAGCTSANDQEAARPYPNPKSKSIDKKKVDSTVSSPSMPKVYGNARFKNVLIKKLGANKYQLTGQGQIFEASFNWVVEDGHNELKSGYTTTDAGAPEWGNFDMTLTVTGIRENSVPHIILFEASAEDGRRTHELAIPLP